LFSLLKLFSALLDVRKLQGGGGGRAAAAGGGGGFKQRATKRHNH